MRKAGLIALAVISLAAFTSCGSSRQAGNGYHGVSNAKANKKQQKEFQKPKHKIKKCKVSKGK